jgi:hypothetical protein
MPRASAGCSGVLASTNYSSDFNDITTGNDNVFGNEGGLYPAGPGFDMATGLGSPNGTNLATDPDGASGTCSVAYTPAVAGDRSQTIMAAYQGGAGYVGELGNRDALDHRNSAAPHERQLPASQRRPGHQGQPW